MGTFLLVSTKTGVLRTVSLPIPPQQKTHSTMLWKCIPIIVLLSQFFVGCVLLKYFNNILYLLTVTSQCNSTKTPIWSMEEESVFLWNTLLGAIECECNCKRNIAYSVSKNPYGINCLCYESISKNVGFYVFFFSVNNGA